MNLCDALESKRFLNGQMIIVQGDQANGMYFIESGVSVYISIYIYIICEFPFQLTNIES